MYDESNNNTPFIYRNKNPYISKIRDNTQYGNIWVVKMFIESHRYLWVCLKLMAAIKRLAFCFFLSLKIEGKVVWH